MGLVPAIPSELDGTRPKSRRSNGTVAPAYLVMPAEGVEQVDDLARALRVRARELRVQPEVFPYERSVRE